VHICSRRPPEYAVVAKISKASLNSSDRAIRDWQRISSTNGLQQLIRPRCADHERKSTREMDLRRRFPWREAILFQNRTRSKIAQGRMLPDSREDFLTA
jgi:hypothetical protein